MDKPISLDEHKKTKQEVLHAKEIHKQSMTINDRVLGWVSDILGSPWVVYIFTIIALVGLTQVRSLMELVQWFSQTFVQFVALAIIQGRSNIQSKFDQARAEMTFQLAKENEKDIHHILRHQDYQSEQIERLIREINKVERN